MPYDEVGRNATNKYRSKYKFIQVRMDPDEHKSVVEFAESKGKSASEFALQAIREKMERDNQSDSEK